MNQQSMFALGLPPTPNPHGMFWCCADCLPITNGQVSITWTPPDYSTGECRFCGREYVFASDYGEDELEAMR